MLPSEVGVKSTRENPAQDQTKRKRRGLNHRHHADFAAQAVTPIDSQATLEGSDNLNSPAVPLEGPAFRNQFRPGVEGRHVILPDEPDEPDEESERDASGLSFLRRIYRHLTSIISLDTFPRSIYSEADQEPIWADSAPTFFVPPREDSEEYIQCYFSYSNVTYRYVSRLVIDELFERFYKPDTSPPKDHGSMAMLLLVMALGCIWLPSWKGNSFDLAKKQCVRIQRAALRSLQLVSSNFPPSLPTVQSYVLNCHLNLALARYDSAWVSLGMAIRLGQMVDLQSLGRPANPNNQHTMSCLFWSMFMLDRYLSLVLGRPTTLNEEDITRPYPETVVGPRGEVDEEESSLMPGVVAHVKLTRIMGHINKRLYPKRIKLDPRARDVAVGELAQEIERWKAETPPFFNPEAASENGPASPFHIVPGIFIR
ncbi:hypothetical protein A1O3_09664 [Capronia epimyces CBS 606.96]|uniref:Xylanolytic transcriptional activator regulatory domain-containing protein n=1 Tax=Capronia epimyces CBS 606.96 TaxID=1182542 RepID=W9XB58_9EURO|nr:uncharacterized protein A1O3_09664 [Capronia epimyces CBS 606.96]EXJ77438.1 hypothetical protein A1O3_09664 [Capronia epimyces CBS 606.96]